MCKYPNVHVKLDLAGPDGNAFNIMGEAVYQAREAWMTEAQCDEYYKEAMSGDYRHLLAVTKRYFNCDFKNEPEER